MRCRPAFVAAPLVLALAACGGGRDRAGQFCAQVRKDQPVITAAVTDPASVSSVVDRFQALARRAPVAIEDDWSVLTELVETAAGLDPTDAAARTRLVTAAYEADHSVQQVVEWVRAVCGIDLTLPVGATPAPTTVAPGPATSALPAAPRTTAAAKPAVPKTTSTPSTTTAPAKAPATTTPRTTAPGKAAATTTPRTTAPAKGAPTTAAR